MADSHLSSDQSATPNTDAIVEAIFNLRKDRFAEYVPASFAREQERMIASLVSDLRSIANNIMAPRYFREIAANAIRRAET